MKYLFLGLLMSVSANSWAGGKECVARLEHTLSLVDFVIDWESNGVTITFAEQVAWYPEALKFDVVYSGENQTSYVVVGRSSQVNPSQLIEIQFENVHMERGTMAAGDLVLPFNRMGKNRKYFIECR